MPPSMRHCPIPKLSDQSQ